VIFVADALAKNFRVLFDASRPLGWIVEPLIFLGAMLYVHAPLSPLAVLQAILLTFPYNLFVFGINDIYDYKSDRINKRKTTIYGLALPPKYHSVVKKAGLASAVLLAASSFLTMNAFNIASMLLLLFFSYYYSAPPMRLKERPPLDSISNGLGVFLVGCLGVSFGGTLADIPLKAYLAAFCVMGIHAFSTITDFAPDSKAGHKTFATVFGKRTAALFALFTAASTLVFSGIRSPIVNSYLVFCSALFLAVAFKPEEKLASLLFKLGFFASLAAGGAILVFGWS
jgi:4-hydroxybenzoate polyprenyltransferase